MENILNLDGHGHILSAAMQSASIPFRSGEFAGPAWQILHNGKWCRESHESSVQDGWFCTQFKGVHLKRKAELAEDCLLIHLEAWNGSSQVFEPDKLNVLLGIDGYMTSYPQWNDRLFPTLLRCEKTHFYGYFSSPQGDVLGIACAEPIASWSLDYNQLFSDGGHRVEGTSLELLNSGPLPPHHPSQSRLMPGERPTWCIQLKPVSSVDQALKWASEVSGAPVVCGERLIFEENEWAELFFYAPSAVTVTCGDRIFASQQVGEVWRVQLPPMSCGDAHVFTAFCGEKTCEVRVCWRKAWSWYIRQAAKQAIEKPQKASTHVESWEGYFSGLQAMRFFPDAERDLAILDSMNEMIPLVYDVEKGIPTHIPERIQNTSGLVSICTDAWQATADEKWLTLAQKLADFLIDRCQAADGSFRNGRGIHYTCVLYIAKSLLELWQAERPLPQYAALAEKHFASARRAVDELVLHLDDIGTEGEHTFEDGMISCEFLQIAFFALQLPESERAPYTQAAEHLLKKHRCLERMGSPDCRSRNSTIRFWESQYDVLIPENMINSPHGWTAWKSYGTWYLYLLTGKPEYLTDTIETLGSCAQLIDASGELRWAFCVDPQNHAGLWQEDPPSSGQGRLVPATYGECYLPMISGWYRAPKGVPVFGYLGTYRLFNSDQGGCCDNDVHECFKAIAEALLLYGYVFEDEQGLHAYNGRLEISSDGSLLFLPADSSVCAVHWNLKTSRKCSAKFSSGASAACVQFAWLCEDGATRTGIPFV